MHMDIYIYTYIHVYMHVIPKSLHLISKKFAFFPLCFSSSAITSIGLLEVPQRSSKRCEQQVPWLGQWMMIGMSFWWLLRCSSPVLTNVLEWVQENCRGKPLNNSSLWWPRSRPWFPGTFPWMPLSITKDSIAKLLDLHIQNRDFP